MSIADQQKPHQQTQQRKQLREQETLILQQKYQTDLARAQKELPPKSPVHHPAPSNPAFTFTPIHAPKIPDTAQFPEVEFAKHASSTDKSTEHWRETGAQRSHLTDDFFAHGRLQSTLSELAKVATLETAPPRAETSMRHAPREHGMPLPQRWIPVRRAIRPHIIDGEEKSDYGRNHSQRQTTSPLIAKITTVPPQPPNLAGMAYMEQTGTEVESRTIRELITILDGRYGKTDSGRSWPW